MKVAVGYLHRTDSIDPRFAFSLLMLCVRDAKTKRRIVGVLDQESSANISAGRNTVVSRFLELGADWLWMVDSDMTFDVDILDRLLVAGQTGKPIVGGLCFGWRPEHGRMVPFPTLYKPSEDGAMVPWFDYPRDEVVPVFSTGAACLLVHRDVLADKRWQDGHPFPWFRESVINGRPASEDQFFAVRAGSLGYPLHVDTAAKCGHVKPLVVDEALYERSRA